MILCFSFLPVLVIGLAIPVQFTTLYSEKKIQEIENFVRSKGEILDLFLEERLIQLKSTGEMHSYEALTTPGKLSEILKIFRANAQPIVDLGIIDMHGQHIVYAGPYDVGTANYADEDWFVATRRRGVHVSDVFLGFRQSPHIALAVLCGDGSQSWVLRATIDASMLTYMVQANRTGGGGDLFILSDAGLLQTHSSLYGPALTAITPEWAAGHPATTRESIGDRQYILATAPLKEVPWILAYAEPSAPYNGLLSPPLVLSASLVLFALLSLGAGTWFIVGTTMKKLEETDRKKALYLESILQANKLAAIERFTGDIVEEMNAPMTLFRESGYRILRLLENKTPETLQHSYGEIHDAASEIEKQANKGAEILYRLLAFSRQLNPFFENLPLHSILNETLAFLQQEADDLGTEIIREFGQPEARVFTDASQLQQALFNVIENAVEAAGKNGVVLIHTEILDGTALVRVKDNGPGIPEEKRAHLFDPLFSDPKTPDTGLGLPISHAIMKRLGGSIEASSSLEKGTVFTIKLPLAPPDVLG